MVRANEQHAESRLGRRPGKVQRVPRQLFFWAPKEWEAPLTVDPDPIGKLMSNYDSIEALKITKFNAPTYLRFYPLKCCRYHTNLLLWRGPRR